MCVRNGRDKIPAIVHVDGSARVQTVRQEHNERLYRLLKEFDALTGVPVLLNTSFNVKGEPIVETPQDAVECFLTTGIDYLAMHDMLIAKNQFHKVLSPVMKDVFGRALDRSGEHREDQLGALSMRGLSTASRWREPLLYAAMSLLIAWHTLAMVVAARPGQRDHQGGALAGPSLSDAAQPGQ